MLVITTSFAITDITAMSSGAQGKTITKMNGCPVSLKQMNLQRNSGRTNHLSPATLAVFYLGLPAILGRNLSRRIYEIWIKYESGRESFIYNDGKVSGISD